MNVTIGSNGTLGPESSSHSSLALKPKNSNNLTLTLINEGTIKSRVDIENTNGFQGTITVKTFENKKTGTIDGRIFMGGDGSGTISIDTFKNEGTITETHMNGNGAQAIWFKGKDNAKVHIKTFKNSGSIVGHGYDNNGNNNSKPRQGVYVQGNVDVTLFENSGTITSEKGQGVHFEGNVHVKTFENKSGGTIESKQASNSSTHPSSYAILLVGTNSNTPTL
ncbi:hypothetical protein DVI03_08855, partial [Campylobacter jejuni]|nr:hypothetical protein [Campylobacter jejuni]